MLSAQTVVQALELRARAGRRSVEFVGREPTLNRQLPDFVATAKRLGFRTIRVNSNGKRLGDAQLANSLMDAGVTDFCISLHSHDPERSDAITVHPGFEQRLAGIRNACRRVPVTLNFVVHEANYREMPEFVEFARATFGDIRRPYRFLQRLPGLAGLGWPRRRGAPFVFFSFVEPVHGMDDALVPRYSDVAPYLERALLADPRATVHQTHTLPPCVISPRLRDRVVPRRATPRRGWMYPAACDGCRLKSRCQGIPRSYVDRYGDSEFKAVR